jgi:hypothetical protein
MTTKLGHAVGLASAWLRSEDAEIVQRAVEILAGIGGFLNLWR